MAPLWTKLMAKYTEGTFPSTWWGEENVELKSLWGGWVTQQYCGERKALLCLGETRIKLKPTASLSKKLTSSSQVCFMSGRDP
jgi:hypothetical protein